MGIHILHRYGSLSVLFLLLAGTGLIGGNVSHARDISGTEKTHLYVTSAGIDSRGNTTVVLYWNPVEGITGFNLYRKEKGAASYPSLPINGKTPISTVKTCDELKAVIPEGSAEWRMFQKAFSTPPSSTGRTVKTKEKSSPGKGDMIMMERKTLSPTLGVGTMRPDLILALSGPCEILQRGLTADEEKRFDVLATVNLKFRLARGLGYIDDTVQANRWYAYELRGIGKERTEIVLARDAEIQAGHYVLPVPPSSLTAHGGDRKILTLWDRNPEAFSYMVQRAQSASGPYMTVNAEPVYFDVTRDLNENGVTPPRPGFVDYQRWDESGLPVSHDVSGLGVDGPENYVTYFYKVASRDILDRTGSWSGAASATATDTTPPSVAENVSVDPSRSPLGIAISWRKVTRDVDGHQELETVQTYRIYRADTLDALDNVASLSAHLAHTLSANPVDSATPTLSWTDTDPLLVPAYGEQDYWYRIQCVDAHGNIGSPSAALSGRVPDVTPPGPTHVTGAEGHADYITVRWQPNTEKDLAGYQVYRSACDRGRPYQPEDKEEKKAPCDFMLLGEVLQEDAEEMLEAVGHVHYDDHTVPAGSALCYAYWVRAFDKARNLYQGYRGCPADRSEYVCQRLYEETAPPAPTITGLKAKSNAAQIDWVSSPIQDLHAFHVYRSEKEGDIPTFVASVFLDGTVKKEKWKGTDPSCDEIPADPDPDAARGTFIDKEVTPHQIYWYRVAAVDWLGNESDSADIRQIPAVSTFTYTGDLPGTPTASTSPGRNDCAVLIRWNPPYKPTDMQGFLVFRGTSVTGPFRQVSPLVPANEFEDTTALPGQEYWYQLQLMDKTGNLSKPSASVRYSP